MISAQKRMEEALAQQSIFDLGQRFWRNAPAQFGELLNEWVSERREGKGNAGDSPLTEI